MQVSPVDIQAWASETGADYPSTPAEKAAVLPAVAAWKREQLADAQAARGQNALATPLMVLGGVGLGLAGLATYHHLTKAGHSPAVATAAAQVVDREQAAASAAAPPPQSAASSPAAQEPAYGNPWNAPYVARAPRPESTAAAPRPSRPSAPQPATTAAPPEPPAAAPVRYRDNRYRGPRLRTDDAGAAATELATSGGVNIGAVPARQQGQYTARSTEGFHNPALASLDTPDKRAAYLANIAATQGIYSKAYTDARDSIAALENARHKGIDPDSFLIREDPNTGEMLHIPGKELYGTTTAEEEEESGSYLAQSRTKSNKSAQTNYQSRETAPQGSLKPQNASVFYRDSNGKPVPYGGTEKRVSDRTGKVYYTGRRKDGTPIAWSDLAYLPNDDTTFYNRAGVRHPELSLEDIAENAGDKADLRYADEEDQSVKGMLEALPASHRRFSSGVRDDGATDNWVFGRVGLPANTAVRRQWPGPLVALGEDWKSPRHGTGPLVPLDLSGFQSEAGAGGPALVAGGRLRRALDDYRSNTGQAVPESVAIAWATSLAKEHNSDAASVLRGAGFKSTTPPPAKSPRVHAPSLGGAGGTLASIYKALGMHASTDEWSLEKSIRTGDLRAAAESLASTLPALTQANGRFLRGATQDEKLNVVAEGLSAGLQDLKTTLEKYPQMAYKFGIGKSAGGFGVDAYLKSYVRDWVTVRSLQLDPSGQPVYQVPADALELIAYEGSKSGRGTIDALEDHIRGARNGLEASLRIDRLVSAAQSTKEGDPNTNATNFAQTVFSMEDDDLISTRLTKDAATDVGLSFAVRRRDDATQGFYDRNPSETLLDRRIDEQGIPAFANATLNAKYAGIDTQAPDAEARIDDVVAAQQWIAANADALERDRENLNRGILITDQGPVSVGRGLVISSGERGAFLAGNTQGMHTAYREEQADDESLTPVDRAQDQEREAILNNQVDPELDPTFVKRDNSSKHDTSINIGVTDAQKQTLDTLDPGELRRLELQGVVTPYSSQKLYFKNLGPGSKGAMSAGEAYAPRQMLRRYLGERGQDQRGAEALDRVFSSGWRPEPGLGFNIGDSEPVRGMGEGWVGGPRPAPPEPLGKNLFTPFDPIPHASYKPVTGIPDGGIDPYSRPVWIRQPGTGRGPVRTVRMLNGDVLTQQLPNNVRLVVPPKGNPSEPDRDAVVEFTTGFVRKGDRRQPLSKEELFALTPMTPRSAVPVVGSPETAQLHQEALDARAINGGEGFRDDSIRRDQIAVDTGAIDAARAANAAMQQQAAARLASEGVVRPGDTVAAARPQILQLDRGVTGGAGRRGSTFVQEPIAAAPVSMVSPEVQEMLNTLTPSAAGAPAVDITQQELNNAHARHIGDWISRAATPRFNSAGAQIAGWTGGDSWHGGARLAGRANQNISPYTPASDAMVKALALAARRRAAV